ncbi:hypothetical protein [Thalassospira alkalitolerans]|uniref:hypothetical protein n=1 Tax=Thalassospira alkalitolerans TaxID=1293890 RepID=UPI003AA856B9
MMKFFCLVAMHRPQSAAPFTSFNHDLIGPPAGCLPMDRSADAVIAPFTGGSRDRADADE